MTHTSNGLRVWNDQRIGKYPYVRQKPTRVFQPNNPIGAKTAWRDPACPFSPFVTDSPIYVTKSKQREKIKDDLRDEAKSRLVLANYQRPAPLEADFPEPEILCAKRRHFKVTRRNRFVREYLVRSPTMEPPQISASQPIVKDRFFIVYMYFIS